MSTEHTVGFECEIDSANHSSADFVDPLIAAGLWRRPTTSGAYGDDGNAHSNHCGCPSCEWGVSAVRPQTDCTCTAELVSDPMPWPHMDSEAVMVQLTDVLDELRVLPGTRAGCHIHVEKDPTRDPNTQAWFSWFEHGFADLARQSFPFVRAYGNDWLGCVHVDTPVIPEAKRIHMDRVRTGFRHVAQRPPGDRFTRARSYLDGDRYGKGPNLSDRGQTWEFRIWNSVVSYWRLYMAVEVSCAFLDAVQHTGQFPDDPPDHDLTLIEFIGPHLTDEGLGYVLRHLADAVDVDASPVRKEGLL
jgi:hypothetical protein